MVQDEVMKLTCHFSSMTGSCLKKYFFLDVKIMATIIFFLKKRFEKIKIPKILKFGMRIRI